MPLSEKKEYRRTRLQQLLAEDYGGVAAEFERQTGIAATLVSRYLAGTKGIGEDMADRIAEASGKPKGWLDSIPGEGALTLPSLRLNAAGSASNAAVTNDNATVARPIAAITAHNATATPEEFALLEALRQVPIGVARDVIQKLVNLYAAPSEAVIQHDQLMGRLNQPKQEQEEPPSDERKTKRKAAGANHHRSRTR